MRFAKLLPNDFTKKMVRLIPGRHQHKLATMRIEKLGHFFPGEGDRDLALGLRILIF